MKLSFSTNAFVKYPVCEAVRKIAAIGYEGVELLADVPHLYADSVTTAELSQRTSGGSRKDWDKRRQHQREYRHGLLCG